MNVQLEVIQQDLKKMTLLELRAYGQMILAFDLDAVNEVILEQVVEEYARRMCLN